MLTLDQRVKDLLVKQRIARESRNIDVKAAMFREYSFNSLLSKNVI